MKITKEQVRRNAGAMSCKKLKINTWLVFQ